MNREEAIRFALQMVRRETEDALATSRPERRAYHVRQAQNWPDHARELEAGAAA